MGVRIFVCVCVNLRKEILNACTTRLELIIAQHKICVCVSACRCAHVCVCVCMCRFRCAYICACVCVNLDKETLNACITRLELIIAQHKICVCVSACRCAHVCVCVCVCVYV